MYFFKWLFLAESFTRDKAFLLDVVGQMEWFSKNMKEVEEYYNTLGFEDENNDDFGWDLLKKDTQNLEGVFEESNWIKYFSLYEYLEPLKRILEEVSVVSHDDVITWGVAVMRLRSNEECCFDFIQSIEKADDNIFLINVSLFGSGILTFNTNDLKNFPNLLVEIFERQPSKFSYREAAVFLTTKFSDESIFVHNVNINDFWSK